MAIPKHQRKASDMTTTQRALYFIQSTFELYCVEISRLSPAGDIKGVLIVSETPIMIIVQDDITNVTQKEIQSAAFNAGWIVTTCKDIEEIKEVTKRIFNKN